MRIKTFQVGAPRLPGEGVRFGVVRFPPRGVRRSDYASENMFDVWLPLLAPSRGLLKTRKQRGSWDIMYWHSFFRRYESEIRGSTDARQAALALAQLARTTHLSIGCTCGANSYCHVHVLKQLLQEAYRSGGEGIGRKLAICAPAQRRLSVESVYSIAHPDELAVLAGRRGRHRRNVGRRWVGARDLLHRAMLTKQRVPIIFGDSTDCSRITHVGLLDDVTVSNQGTAYLVSRVRPVRAGRCPQDLTLVSTGQRIKRHFRRSYAICRTPDFVSPRLFGV